MENSRLQRRSFLMLSTASLALSLAGCVEDLPNAAVQMSLSKAEDKRLLEFFSRTFTRELEDSPEFMTAIGIKKRYSEWNDYSESFIDASYRKTVADTEFLRTRIDRAALSPSMRVSYDIFLFRNEQRIANYPFRFHNYDVSHFNGPHQNIPSLLTNQHRVDDLADAQAYVARIRGTGTVMDQVIDMMRKANFKGITLPRFSYVLLRADAKKVCVGAPFDNGPDNSILHDFKVKVANLNVSPAAKATLVSDATDALLQQFKPAYERFIAAIADIAYVVKFDHGVGELPDGAAFYNERIAAHTTLKTSAKDIHALGLSEVARLSAEMKKLKHKLRFKGSLKAFYEDLRTNPKYFYPTTEQGRSDYMQRARELLRASSNALPKAFGSLPKAKIEVKRMESFLESGQTIAFYNAGTPDGSRPGYVYYNLASMAALPKWQIAALTFHEGIPGHHVQISIAQETRNIPEFRKYTGFTSYVEGWALYTELLSKQMGLYHNDLDEVGRITMELWRACRLVVDTGIHIMGWSREKSVNYFLANTALTKDNVVREVDRYCVYPGQACAYQIGKNKILSLREQARKAMGKQFDIRKYHDTILQNGAVPLPVLESIVEEWVRSSAAPV